LALLLEFSYRALAIFYLDGDPIAFGHGFLPGFTVGVVALDHVPDTFPFQRWAPFGFFPARIGEFAFGIWLAVLWVQYRQRIRFYSHPILGPMVLLLCWFASNALLYLGITGWVFADALIGVSLTVLVIAVSHTVRSELPRLFKAVSWLGTWSLYLFLVHLPLMYVFAALYPVWQESLWLEVAMLCATFLAIAGSCWGLRVLEQMWRSRRVTFRATSMEHV
jgi:peptidoglycan/LPS O-acetylase OafA/YrhL